MWIELQFSGYNIGVIATCVPTDIAPDGDKTDFYNILTNLLVQITNRKEVYILGEPNDKMGKQNAIYNCTKIWRRYHQ